MKKSLFVLVILLAFTGCAGKPPKVLMKNCKEDGKGSDLYYCEEISSKTFGRGPK